MEAVEAVELLMELSFELSCHGGHQMSNTINKAGTEEV